LDAAVAAGARRFVYVSSSLAAATEGDATPYGQDKRAAEEALLAAGQARRIEVIILRAVNIYGVGMRGNIAAMIRLIQRGWLPRLPRFTNTISLIGVDDVARALGGSRVPAFRGRVARAARHAHGRRGLCHS
jgi:nucleoside-diphosphate-sugar epimerase